MIELHIKDFLKDDTDITNRVGGRIFPGHAPQKTAGAVIILQNITTVPEYTIIAEAGVHDVILQVTCYDDTQYGVFTLAALVRNRMSGYRGSVGNSDAVDICSCRIISSGAIEETPERGDGSDRWVNGYRFDFAFFQSASVPTLT